MIYYSVSAMIITLVSGCISTFIITLVALFIYNRFFSN